MDAAFEKKLIASLDALAAGESLQAVLARYPEDAAELRPLLETAARLSEVRVAHSLAAQARSRQGMLEQAEAIRAGAVRPVRTTNFLQKLALAFVAVAIFVVLAGLGLSYASATAVPGDVLYGAKRSIEEVRLSLTTDGQARQLLSEQFEQERRHEIEMLLDQGREVNVTFNGEIEALEGDQWLVSGLPVVISELTTIVGQPATGQLVSIDGVTRNGVVEASRVIMLGADTPLPTPDETPKVDAEPEEKPTATPSPQPTNTATSTSTPTPTPVEPTATVTPAPALPAPPADDDNVDDNGDDAANDNGGENDNNDDNDDFNDNDDANDNEAENDNDGDDNENRNENDSEDNENNANTNEKKEPKDG